MTSSYPLGAAALHPGWTEGRFNVSGMFCYEPVVLGLLKMAEKSFDCRVPIEAIHGAPGVRWNAGRVIDVPFRAADLAPRLASLYSMNVGCYLTFSNHRLEAPDLGDSTCNYLLDQIAQRPDLNGVIVGSDLLSRYIARKYPDLRQIASVTRVAVEGGKGRPEYYRELGKRFHRYVVHPDDCGSPEVLDRLDRDKAEILVNENCLRDCPLRPRHMETIALSHRLYGDSQLAAAGVLGGVDIASEHRMVQEESNRIAAECASLPIDRQLNSRRRNCNLTTADMKAIYNLGFRFFKIQGRRDPVYAFAYDLARYTLEPEFAAPLVFKMLCRKIVFT